MASEIRSYKPIEPEFKVRELKDGTMIEVIPRSEFWTSVVIVLITIAAIPYLSYCLFSFYDKVDKDTLGEDKSLYENMWIGSIILLILLTISVIIFISFYFKNFNKTSLKEDDLSIERAFQLISREVAQHAADEYSDNKVNAHLEDMRTLGGRITAASAGDKWYDKPSDFLENYQKSEDGISYKPKGTIQTVSEISKAKDDQIASLQQQLAQSREREQTAEAQLGNMPEGTPPEIVKQEQLAAQPPVQSGISQFQNARKAKQDAPYVPW